MFKRWPLNIHNIALCTLLLSASSCRDQIVHDLSERQANLLRTELNGAGLESSCEQQPDGRWAVSVERDDAMPALNYLNSHRVLREESKSIDDKGSIISNRDDQRFRYERALSGEIEATLRSIEGVLEARVHLNLPVTDPLFGQQLDKGIGSGSVLVVASSQLKIPSDAVAALVAGASGVDSAKISVLINNTATDRSLTKNAPVTSQAIAPIAQTSWIESLRANFSFSSIGYLLVVCGAGIMVLSIAIALRSSRADSSKRAA